MIDKIVQEFEKNVVGLAAIIESNISDSGQTHVAEMKLEELHRLFSSTNLSLSTLISKQIEAIEKLESKCTCGCDFGDACLCREKRDGFNSAKEAAITILKTFK